IENMSLIRPDLSIDSLITLCLSKRSWQRKLINEYAILWRKVQENEL
uniref:LysR family transcriptional regulator n=1 Tax=Panagrolaimus sp. PS1159 TaxID=55785 RepID=A0AC35GM17_9BILA